MSSRLDNNVGREHRDHDDCQFIGAGLVTAGPGMHYAARPEIDPSHEQFPMWQEPRSQAEQHGCLQCGVINRIQEYIADLLNILISLRHSS